MSRENSVKGIDANPGEFLIYVSLWYSILFKYPTLSSTKVWLFAVQVWLTTRLILSTNNKTKKTIFGGVGFLLLLICGGGGLCFFKVLPSRHAVVVKSSREDEMTMDTPLLLLGHPFGLLKKIKKNVFGYAFIFG